MYQGKQLYFKANIESIHVHILVEYELLLECLV